MSEMKIELPLEAKNSFRPKHSVPEVPQCSFQHRGYVGFPELCSQKGNNVTLHKFPLPTTTGCDRADLIQSIQNSVQTCGKEEHPYRKMIVLHGFGGMGKSEVAKLWAHKFHTQYDYVVWFDAGSESKLLGDFRALANKLEVQFENKEGLHTVYASLAERFNSGVFIFDNAQRLTDLQGEFGVESFLYFYHLPRKPVIVVTSRRGDTFWGLSSEKIRMIHIPCFSVNESSVHYNHPIEKMPKGAATIRDAFAPTVAEMLIRANGSLGKALLDIVTILGPNPAHAELVNAIYNNMPNSSSPPYGDFSWSDLSMPVRKGLKALQNFSLIDVTTSTETIFHCERRLTFISLHPIIHDASLRSIRATENTATLVGTVCNVFQENDRNESYFEEMKAILDQLTTNQFGEDKLYNSVMMLCKSMLEGRLPECGALEHLSKLRARADGGNQTGLSGILRVVELFVSKVVPESFTDETFSITATEISSLLPECGSRPWIFNSCVYVLSKMLPIFFPMQPTDDLQELGDLMLSTWRASKPRSYRHCPILCALCLSKTDATDIACFISTVLSAIHEDDRLEFFQDLVKLRNFFLKSRGSWFIDDVLSSSLEDLVTRALDITETRSKMKLLKHFDACSAIFNHFTSARPNSFSNSKTLAEAVWKYTEFSLDLITTNPYGWELESLHTWDAAVSEVISMANYFIPKSEPEHVALASKKDLETKCKEWLENVTLYRKDIEVDQDRQPWLQFILRLQGDSVRNFGAHEPSGSLSPIEKIDSGDIHRSSETSFHPKMGSRRMENLVSIPEGNRVEEAMKLIEEGNHRIKLDANLTDAVLLLGNTGAGKTTVAKLLAEPEDLQCYKATTGILIRDQNHTISDKATLVTKTIFPELVVDEATKTAFYDLPGFRNTRTESMEIANACFIKKVAEHTKRVKLVFVISYSSLDTGGSRIEFKTFLEQTIALLKDPTKFTPSVALVVTKASGSESFSDIIAGVTEFLEESKEVLRMVFPDGSECKSATSIIDALLTKDSSGNYCRIGVFRTPMGIGPVNQLEGSLSDKEQISRLICSHISYTPTSPDDFGVTLSHSARCIVMLTGAKMIQKVTEIMQVVGQKIQGKISNHVKSCPSAEIGRLFRDQKKLEEEVRQLRTQSTGDGRNFFEKLQPIASRLNCENLVSKELEALNHTEVNLKFLNNISGKAWPVNIQDWCSPLQPALETFEAALSRKVLAFANETTQIMNDICANLDGAIQRTLQTHNVNRSLTQGVHDKYTNALGHLTSQLRKIKSVNPFIQQVESCVKALDVQVSTSKLRNLSVDLAFETANINPAPWLRSFEILQGNVSANKNTLIMECNMEVDRIKLENERRLHRERQEQLDREVARRFQELFRQQAEDARRREEELRQIADQQRIAAEAHLANLERIKQEEIQELQRQAETAAAAQRRRRKRFLKWF